MSQLSWEELLKGLGGVGALLIGISKAAVPLSANSAGMIKAGVGITAIAIAMNLLAMAVAKFGGMSMTELGKGLGSVAAGLGIMVVAMTKMPARIWLRQGGYNSQLLILLIANTVAAFGAMDWGTITKGLTGIAGAIIAIAVGMRLMPPNIIFIAIGLIGIMGVLQGISKVVESFGGMSIRQMAKGLIGLAVSLDILAAALYAMEGTGAAALSLAIVAAGLALLAPALVSMGKMGWKGILVALVGLAAALTILSIAAALITPIIPSLIGLGAAFLLMGAGLALAGAGLFLAGTGVAALAAGLAALVVAAPAGVGILISALNELALAIPRIAKNLILAFLEIVNQLAAVAPKFVEAMVTILGTLVDAIIQASPKIAQAFSALLDLALRVLSDNQGKIIQAGFDLLVALLQGIKNNIPKLISLVGDIVVKFITSLASQYNKILNAGTQVLVQFLKGISDRISTVVTAVGEIITKFISAVGDKFRDIVAAGLKTLTKFLSGISENLKDAVEAGGKVIAKLIEGIGAAAEDVAKSARKTAKHFMHTLATEIPKLAQDVFDSVILLINGMADVIEKNSGPLRSAGQHLGWVIMDGMTFGLAGKARDVYNKATEIAQNVANKLHLPFLAKSPSRLMMELGKNIMLGLSKGLTENAQLAYTSADIVSNGVLKSFKAVFQVGTGSGVMYDIGKTVVTGFAQGIRGSTDDITSAFGDLNSKLVEAMSTAKTNITTEQKKLNDLLKAEKPDLSAIKASQKVISENEDILKKSTATHEVLITTLKRQGVELLKLSTAYDTISKNLDKAQTDLDTLKQKRDDAIASFTSQFDTLPDIVTKDAEGNEIDQLATYMSALDNQAKAITAYQSTLDQLRLLGLDDQTYQKLLSEGPEDQRFADSLLAGGKTAVTSLNTLDLQLKTASETLSKHAGEDLFKGRSCWQVWMD
jgi:hypothetical protein